MLLLKESRTIVNYLNMYACTVKIKANFVLWQYELSSFQAGDIKWERCLPKNQHTQSKSLNFENWCSGKLSKIGHHFKKQN